MIRRSLLRRLVGTYIFCIVTGLLLTLGVSNFIIENYLEKSISKRLYTEAYYLSTAEFPSLRLTDSDLDEVSGRLSSIAKVQNATLWVLTEDKEILIQTDETSSLSEGCSIENFDPTDWGNRYYQIGTFYDSFPEKTLSVLSTISSDLMPKGYIILHYPMKLLYAERRFLVLSVLLISVLLFILMGLMLFVYYREAHVPLKRIRNGIDAFGKRKFNFIIDVGKNASEEFCSMADTLNYMASSLHKQQDLQRDYISNISHDIRSPLTSIRGYAQAIVDGTIPPELHEKYLGVIIHEADRLNDLSSTLLKLDEFDQKKRQLHLTTFDIHPLIRSTCLSFEGQCINKLLTLTLDFTGSQMPVTADFEQIQQVLYNLLDNAIKFSPKNSTIEVGTSYAGSKVFVFVKDHGCGISPQVLPRIWDRFYKEDASRGKDKKGTGLGLSIVQEIIHAHGQNIDCISTQGIGTEFVFSLDKGPSLPME